MYSIGNFVGGTNFDIFFSSIAKLLPEKHSVVSHLVDTPKINKILKHAVSEKNATFRLNCYSATH